MSTLITAYGIKKDIFGPCFDDLKAADKTYILGMYGKALHIGDFKPNDREQLMYSSIYVELLSMRSNCDLSQITIGDVNLIISNKHFATLEGADKVYIYALYGKASRIGSFKPSNREQEMYGSILRELQLKNVINTDPVCPTKLVPVGSVSTST